MTRDFQPLFRNPHVLTILGNYWPRRFDFSPFPSTQRFIQTEPDVQVRVDSQMPIGAPRAHLITLHGLEGSGESGYIISLAYAALTSGFAVHRFHMRTCGATEHLCQTLYHAGLTSDLIAFLKNDHRARPTFLIGFSLGGNVALKAAAETGRSLFDGVATVAAPIDLAACARRLDSPENRLYGKRFVERMKARLMRTGRYSAADLEACRSIYEIDDRITAPSFGFGTADNYYATQSSKSVIGSIQIPVLMIAAQDDTLVPYESYLDPAIRENPRITLLSPEHGGHLGFVSRNKRRFWADEMILEWIAEQLN